MGKSGRKSGEEWSCGEKAIGVEEESFVIKVVSYSVIYNKKMSEESERFFRHV